MVNKKTFILLGLLGIIAIPLLKAKPSSPVEEGWIWDQAQWDLNKWF